MTDKLAAKRKLARLLLEKKEMRAANPLKYYKPLNYQDLFHQASDRIRFFVGANRCGKTTAGVVESIYIAGGTHPHSNIKVPNHGRVLVADFANSINGYLLPKFKEWMPLHYLRGGSWETALFKNQQGIPNRIEFANGSQIIFMSGDQDVKKFESFDADWIYFDEPPSEEIYFATIRSLVDRNGIHWFCMTPINCAWMYEQIYEPAVSGERKDTFTIHALATENIYLSAEGRDAYFDHMPTDQEQARKYGAFSHLTGSIFKDFILEEHVIDSSVYDAFKGGWPEGWPVIEAIDPHVTGNKPHAVLWLGIDQNDFLHVIDCMSFNGTIQELGEAIKVKRKGKSIIQSMSDSALNQKVDRQNQYNLLCMTGVRPRLAKKKNLVIPGINYISSLLKEKKLFIWDTCQPVIRNFKLYMWNPNREGEPTKKNDDYIDCLRYALECNHTFKQNTEIIKTVDSFESYGG